LLERRWSGKSRGYLKGRETGRGKDEKMRRFLMMEEEMRVNACIHRMSI